MNNPYVIICLMTISVGAWGQLITLGGEGVPVKIINYSNDGNFVGRTHLNPYELKINSTDSLSGFNIGTENGDIKCFDFSSTGDTVAIGTYQGYLEFWNIKIGRRLSVFRVHEGQINDLKFLTKQSVVSCGRDGTIKKTSVDSPQTTLLLRQSAIVNSVEVLSNGMILFGDHSGIVGLIDSSSGARIRSAVAHDGIIFDVKADESHQQFFTAGHDGLIGIWKLPLLDLKCYLNKKAGAIFSIDYDAGSNQLVSGGVEGVVNVWDLTTKNLIQSFGGHSDYVFVVRVTPDKNVISGSRDLTYRIWKKK